MILRCDRGTIIQPREKYLAKSKEQFAHNVGKLCIIGNLNGYLSLKVTSAVEDINFLRIEHR